MNGSRKQGQDEFRSAVIMTVIWVAGLTLVVIFVGLFAGIQIDNLLHSKPLFTVALMITSIPITIFLTLRVVKTATRRIQPGMKKANPEEGSHRGEDD
jgi:F0F1-type ATP synthase assembly protein I